MPAKAKQIQEDALVVKATTIFKNNHEIQTLTVDNESKKDELISSSKQIFYTDLGVTLNEQGVPAQLDISKKIEVYGNHEYVTPDGLLTVNFKTQSLQLREVNGEPADVYLKRTFGDEGYKKLFKEGSDIKITDPDMHEKAASDSKSYNYRIESGLDDSQTQRLAEIVKSNKDLFGVSPKDQEAFKKAFPALCESKTVVTPNNGLLEKLDKLDDDTLKNAQSFLAGFLGKTLNGAVKCGNKAKN